MPWPILYHYHLFCITIQKLHVLSARQHPVHQGSRHACTSLLQLDVLRMITSHCRLTVESRLTDTVRRCLRCLQLLCVRNSRPTVAIYHALCSIVSSSLGMHCVHARIKGSKNAGQVIVSILGCYRVSSSPLAENWVCALTSFQTR